MGVRGQLFDRKRDALYVQCTTPATSRRPSARTRLPRRRSAASNGTGTAGATVTLNLVVSKSVAGPTPIRRRTQLRRRRLIRHPIQRRFPIHPMPTPGTGASPVGVITVMESTVAVDHAIQVNGLSSNLQRRHGPHRQVSSGISAIPARSTISSWVGTRRICTRSRASTPSR